ncbi:MAG: alpha/beta fold hydrolase [Magnetococcales bacterium]|nr:alpha/beta fold hydrolase [Magnetococcales bacterium]
MKHPLEKWLRAELLEEPEGAGKPVRSGEADPREPVILLHGLWMTGLEMITLARRLEHQGFQVERFKYPTVSAGVGENAQRLREHLLSRYPGRRVHFVGHSLGGLVMLHMAVDSPDLPLGRMVALGTPFLGSWTARRLAHYPLGEKMLGRSLEGALAWGGPRCVPERIEMGIIAGTFPLSLTRLLWGVEYPNDGTVSVSETMLPGAREHLRLPVTHMGTLFSKEVAELTGRFLRKGRFGGKRALSEAGE